MEVEQKKVKKEPLKSYAVIRNFTYKGKDYRVDRKDKIKLNNKQAKEAKKNNMI